MAAYAASIMNSPLYVLLKLAQVVCKHLCGLLVERVIRVWVLHKQHTSGSTSVLHSHTDTVLLKETCHLIAAKAHALRARLKGVAVSQGWH